MPASGHRPVRNTDPAAPARETRRVVVEAAVERPRESTCPLPYYQPPEARRRRSEAAAVVREAMAPAEAVSGPVRDAAEGSFGRTVMLEAVLGNDDRVRVADPLMRTNPWRQICALRIKANTGAGFVGTAWFIGPRVLATAGHCVFMQKEGGWPRSIDVIPGKFGASEPYGRATATRFASVEGWVKDGGREFDYGVIFLDDPALGARIGNFEVEAALDAELPGHTARISGYPADRDRAEFQYFHERPLMTPTATLLEYDIDTFGGQSGSPVWRQVQNGPPVAIGIHTTGGVTSNFATRISEPVLDNLIHWTEER